MSRTALVKNSWLFGVLLGLAHCTSTNPEFPDASACEPGDRQCGPATDRPLALVCGRDAADRQIYLEEPCPQATQCDSGRCLPAAGQTACQHQDDCPTGQSCVPLVVDGTASALGTFCVPSQAAAAAPGAACTRDSDCQTYRCLQGPTRRYCLQACVSDGQCGLPNPCRTFNITVTGVQGTVRSCSPP